ncbi:hypothetical protein [Roseateles asaccharophilus]|uniref:Uncharacterized protein n=1 Tax=Roseateles asaccharophilus TaxID=582607 RepID=A0ABU2AAT1_9BURK|nr:hypothetical protein [Roseateles asaccharophilus]MDR7333582.1 hypothetical protein [Roseateles asaccharophilus]
MLKRLLAAIAISLPLAAPAEEAAKPTQTIALISTLGDQLSIVKQRGKRASSIDDFSRRTLQIDPQLLNMSVLRGLDSALAAEEPNSRRIMLRWSANPGLAEQLKNASFEARDALVLDALRERLTQMPQRADWDRIEAILPRFSWETREGMPNRLGGIGIYVKPTGNQWELLDEDGIDRKQDLADPDQTTINPRTGEQQKDKAYVAPFISFERVTLDAKTLAVVARKPQFTHTKYSDPNSKSIDVVEQVSPAELVTQLNKLVEQAAYRSVRGAVEVGPVKQVPAEAGKP